MTSRLSAVLWWILALFATGIGGYGVLLIDARRVTDAVPGLPWLDEVHFFTGGVALMVGVWGFRRDLLVRRRAWHRRIGKLYVVMVLVSGVAALLMACFAMGGVVTHLGFGIGAVFWLTATTIGWHRIHKRRDVAAHRRWMVRSYALTCAAITLRLQLAPLSELLGGFTPAYRVVSWSAWIPNLIAAEIWLRWRPKP